MAGKPPSPGRSWCGEHQSVFRAGVESAGPSERRSGGRYLRDPLSTIVSVSKGPRDQGITASQLQDGVRNWDFRPVDYETTKVSL